MLSSKHPIYPTRLFEDGEGWVAADILYTKEGVLVMPKSGVYLTCPFCGSMAQSPMRDRWSVCICSATYMIGEPRDTEGEQRVVENYDPRSGMVVTGLGPSVLEMLKDSGLVNVVFERE